MVVVVIVVAVVVVVVECVCVCVWVVFVDLLQRCRAQLQAVKCDSIVKKMVTGRVELEQVDIITLEILL